MSIQEDELDVLRWVGSSQKDLGKFPDKVKREVGRTLTALQSGEDDLPNTKPLKGFKGAGVCEIIEHDPSGTYRTVYAVKFAGFVYVLHAFQKKSKKGIATPASEIEKVERRLKLAEKEYKDHLERKKIDEQRR